MSHNSYPEQFSEGVADGAITREQSAIMARFINRVYGWMCAGLGLTALVAHYVATNESARQAILGNKSIFIVLLIVEIALVMGLSFAINKINSTAAAVGFALYAALNGMTLASIFLVYTMGSIATVFLITSGTFGATSLYGYVTKRDLSTLGNIMFMALIGIIIATVVNIFLKSPALYWIISYVGVAVFVGLTAYDTQKIRRMAVAAAEGEITEEVGKKGAIMGALTLYLDFINLFLMLLRIFGDRR